MNRRQFIQKGILYAAALSLGHSISREIRKPKFLDEVVEDPLKDLDLSRNIGHIALDIERNAGFNIPDYPYELLDEIIEKAKTKITENQTPEEKLRQIAFLLIDMNFAICPKGVNRLSQSLSLENYQKYNARPIDCDTGSLIHLSIGEALGLPLKGVYTPAHFFIRWHFENGKYFNWEVTHPSKTTDQDYIQNFGISQQAINNGVYLKSLDRKELLSLPLIYTGEALLDLGLNKMALCFYNKALELCPNNLTALFNRGMASASSGEFSAASRDAKRIYDLGFKARGIEAYSSALRRYLFN